MRVRRLVSLREKKKRAKLRRIEVAARALFAERGYEATTTREIAERAEIATGTLFTYFPEKRALLLHLVRADIDEALEAAFDSMPQVPPADPVDALRHLFGAIFAAYGRDERLARVFVRESLFIEGDVGVEMATWTMAFVTRLALLLDGWRREGVLAAHADGATAAYQVFAQYYFGLVGWLGSPAITPEVRDSLFHASLRQLVRGLEDR